MSGIVCPSCIKWNAEIDAIRSPYRFNGTIREAVHQLKYRNIRVLAEPMSRLLYNYIYYNPIPGDTLVPVPLHAKRLKERGYNQSSLIAHNLGKLSELPVVDNCLVRTRHIQPQARTANVDERRENVEGAFSCLTDELRGKQVILIDDVSTSGATMNACAHALKEAGASTVWGLVVAREI